MTQNKIALNSLCVCWSPHYKAWFVVHPLKYSRFETINSGPYPFKDAATEAARRIMKTYDCLS